jgi:hypothetical protein
MNMGMGMSHKMRTEQRATISLETKSRVYISQRIALLQILTLEEYVPTAVCPQCEYHLTDEEILIGFNRDPNDYTTACPKCGKRFAPKLRCVSNTSDFELPFYCKCQALKLIQDMNSINTPPEELAKAHPEVYYSLIVHFGTIKAAFKSVGQKYPFKERKDWKGKVFPFLGQIPDQFIADCIGVSASTIGRLRRSKKISRFQKK